MVDVILPALNEALALPEVLSHIPQQYRVIVVDNGSSDATATIAESLGATVVHEPHAGYGAAVHAGVLSASSDLVAVMDADGSLSGADLPGLVALVSGDQADLVIGRRCPTSRSAWPWHARVGNRLVAARLSRSLHLSLHDIGPMRVCRRQALIDLQLTDRRFGYPVETLIKAAQAGWRIVERDVNYGPRAEGTKSKVTGSVSGTAKAMRDLYRVLT